ncbi:MAG: nitroreductase family deazaflavin-dependent oxidoreductase [Chloroflexi bacterium]|nr:nitroreductase family deazaflavin-dependent oxidoreductase [Chloroflexota bacterium]
MARSNLGFVWRVLRFMNQRVATRIIAGGGGPQRVVLLLTTTGRKSGLPRVTPLQFEEIDGAYYVGSARGAQADWFRNIVAHPRVEVQIRQMHFAALAEPITDAARIADFLELRLRRHPVMIRAMLLMHGLLKPTRANIERLASGLALVVVRPEQSRKEL